MDRLVHNSWGQPAYHLANQRKSATVKKLNRTQLKNRELLSEKKNHPFECWISCYDQQQGTGESSQSHNRVRTQVPPTSSTLGCPCTQLCTCPTSWKTWIILHRIYRKRPQNETIVLELLLKSFCCPPPPPNTWLVFFHYCFSSLGLLLMDFPKSFASVSY